MKIKDALRSGYVPQPLYDPVAGLPYALALFVIVATIALWQLTGFTLGPSLNSSLFRPWLPLVYFIMGPLTRRIGYAKLAGAIECFGFLYGQVIFLLTLLPLTALSGPLVDEHLAAWDRALGFDWIAFTRSAMPFVPLLEFAYRTFVFQSLCIVAVLFCTSNELRAWKLVTASMIAVIICSALYPFFPAETAMTHYGFYPTSNHGGVVVGPLIEEIKNGARVIESSMLKGLITFPSYHAAAAFLFTWATWRVRLLRWPIVLLNIVMTIATIVVGSHYLVDILGGWAVAGVSLWLAEAWVSRWRSRAP